MDQVRENYVPFSEGSHLKTDVRIFETETTGGFSPDPSNRLNLFDFNFDHGTALVEELGNLFKMAK